MPPIRLDAAIRNQALRVHSALRAVIVDGALAPGARLPSSRDMARRLGVGRNVVVAAFEHLISDGLIEARRGSGAYVSARLPPPPRAAAAPQVAAMFGRRMPFALGHTHVAPLFLARLGAAARRHIAEASLADLGYGDPRGSARLRREIAAFLAVNRGLRCDPDCVVVVSGAQHGLRLCVDALLSRGDSVWVEEPGYFASRNTLTAAGMRLAPVPVDAGGLDVAASVVLAPRAKAAYVTPSHQFPAGVTLEMSRRTALIAWAQAAGAWVFEDDYDSEFRYSGPPLTALASLSPHRVIYLGTFAKTLFAGLRLGYLAAPPQALARILNSRAAIDRFPPVFLQNALADLMADGSFAAHLRKSLRLYRAARDLVADAVATASRGVLRPDVPDQGLHMIAWLPSGATPELAREIRRQSKVEAMLFSETQMQPGAAEGFVLGFSGFEADALRSAATALGAAALRLVNAAR
ncbi:MAG TPA: PLP-dependent aminotransferase family protein [Roseiarcus sp.]|nr:PLP-dependent aminotransferase family protein [Roseiarcus sp.]